MYSSAVTVSIYSLLVLRWVSMAAAVTVGCGLALWPHMISMCGYVLSETLLGFLVAGGLLALQMACERSSTGAGLGAGLLFAAAALTNAVLTPLLPVFAAVAAWRDNGRRTLWVAVLIGATLPSAAWIARSATLPPERTASDRMAMNFAQGSWPEYHLAWAPAMTGDPKAKAVMSAIDSDTKLLTDSPRAGMSAIFSRLLSHPGHYLGWYLSKPIELWGWSIGIGAGDLYPYPTFNSPLAGVGPLGLLTLAMAALNPLIFVLALAGFIVIFRSPTRWPPSLFLAASAAAFVTIVFTLLQSDARYSTPYRGIEWSLSAIGASALTRAISRMRNRGVRV